LIIHVCAEKFHFVNTGKHDTKLLPREKTQPLGVLFDLNYEDQTNVLKLRGLNALTWIILKPGKREGES
jgi:hypothetical protein